MARVSRSAKRHADAAAFSERLRWLLVAGCVSLTVYGTLFPFSGWRLPTTGSWLFSAHLLHDISAPDVLANILLYMPLGFVMALQRRWPFIVHATAAAFALSLSLETAQAFLPSRTSSFLDIGANTFGAGLGAACALAIVWPTQLLKRSVWMQLQHDRVAWLGLAAVATWMCAQLLPFVPSLDIGNLKAGLKPLWHAWQGTAPTSLWRSAVYALATAALMVTAASALRAPRRTGLVAAALLAVLPLKVLVIGRQLSPAALGGTTSGVALGLALLACGQRRALWCAATCIVIYVIAEALQPGTAGSATHPFNWLPLRAQINQPINGLANLADAIWPLLALACLCRRLHTRSLWPLLPAVVALLCGVEWVQHWVPGRYPDITTVLAGAVTWIVAAAYAGAQPTEPDTTKT